jgi:hypothetical protein
MDRSDVGLCIIVVVVIAVAVFLACCVIQVLKGCWC